MYPHRELSDLGARKAALRVEIAHLRTECEVAAAVVTRPLVLADKAIAWARSLSPLAVIASLPLGAIARVALERGVAGSRMKFLGPLVKWAPVVFTAVRGLQGR